MALILLLTGTVGMKADDSPSAVKAGHRNEKITIDGALNEPSWKVAGVIPSLTQQDPHPGEPTYYVTEVRILVDKNNLYFGVICHDPEPERIAMHSMQRDGDISGDDTVAIVLDTFGDRQRGYLFEINAAGARRDGLISGPDSVSNDWDGVWEARTQITQDGWTAEIRIPAQTLRFTPGTSGWGFNAQRKIARDRTTLRWKGITLDANFDDLQRAGVLEGVADLRQGSGLSFSPFGLWSREADLQADTSSSKSEFGADITYNFTPQLTGLITFNTDFAETEVDTRQVNLTRFPLFFPEKRSFFLEGSNLFSFGSDLDSDFIPFFSRRIGLYQGQQVPLEGGAKILGQVGKWEVAALSTVTGETEYTARTSLFAGRATYHANDNLTLGSIFTNGDPAGVKDNSLIGIDALWRTSSFHGDKNLSVGGWAAMSMGDKTEGRNSGWGFNIDYPNDLWDFYFRYKEFGEGLDPALGFLPRPGTRWYTGGGVYQPRPESGAFGWIRQFFFEFFLTYVEDLNGQVESWRVFTAPFNARTESGEHLEANWAPQFERLTEPFEIAKGVIIPVGDYQFTRYRVEAQSAEHRSWQVGGTVWFGDFYTGSLVQIESYINFTSLHGQLQLELNNESDIANLPEGDFTQRLWQLKVAYSFSPDLIFSSYTQYDSESRNLGINNRLRWTIQPGNDLFIVWNHGWEEPIASRDRFSFQQASDQLVIKIRWTFRK